MLGGVTSHMLPHLHGVLCGNSGGFGGDDVTRDNSQRRFLAQHSVATLFRIVTTLSQHCNAMLALKQRRRASSKGTTKTQLVQTGKTTTLHVHHAFLYIFLPSL